MSKKIEARKCEVCGKKFTPKAVNQRYCSAKCKTAMKRKVEQEKREAKKNGVTAVVKEKVVLPKKPTNKAEASKPKKPVADKTTVEIRPCDPYKAIALAFIVMMIEARKIISASTKHAQKAVKKGK